MNDAKTKDSQAASPGAENSSTNEHAPDDTGHGKGSIVGLAIGSIGVVYGDIGTSPLYAFREALHHTAVNGITREEVTGVVSLLLWALTIVVTIKYVLFILFADNKGEGGTLTLLALARRALGKSTGLVFLLGALGAALFYGDAVITPAMSVLSAVEGINAVAHGFDHWIIPITICILVVLFAVQSRGTAMVATWFGPIMLLWFGAIAMSGVYHVFDDPRIFYALNPYHSLRFIGDHGMLAFVVLGSVFLAVTGAEALYADMGHFGRKPIQLAWLVVAFPALTLNYLGQGALVLANPHAAANPFFLMAPDSLRLPYVILAMVATVIASQAVITGAYSATQQAVQLGLLPRLESRHTSETQAGQIYLPRVNWLLLASVVIVIIYFRSSAGLASAYGISVTGEMVVTSLLAFVVVWKYWKWPLGWAIAIITPFLAIEFVFLSANLTKVFDGGYIPLSLALLITVIMWTWVRGSELVYEKSHRENIPLSDLLKMLGKSHPVRVNGTAVFLTSDPDIAPSALLHNLKHNNVLHAKNIIMTVHVATTPRYPDDQRVKIEPLSDDFVLVELTFGYMETPNVPRALAECRRQGIKFDIMATSFFLNRRSFKPSPQSPMPVWQNRLFISLTRMAANATDFYRLPSNRVVELGQQLTV